MKKVKVRVTSEVSLVALTGSIVKVSEQQHNLIKDKVVPYEDKNQDIIDARDREIEELKTLVDNLKNEKTDQTKEYSKEDTIEDSEEVKVKTKNKKE